MTARHEAGSANYNPQQTGRQQTGPQQTAAVPTPAVAADPAAPAPSPAPAADPAARDRVRVRDRIESDSIPAITRLLHRAYAKQVEMGLKPLAGRQGDDVTLERANNSECIIALLAPPPLPAVPAPGATGPAGGIDAGETIVGVILFEEMEKVDFPPWFLRPDVCHFAQFAVDPDTQGLGIGGRLLAEVERRARERDASELALSMAEPDRDLFNFYVKRGFRWVDVWQWPYTNYRSCIMSKMLL